MARQKWTAHGDTGDPDGKIELGRQLRALGIGCTKPRVRERLLAHGALLVVLGCAAKAEPSGTGEESRATLATQRVIATVQRQALRLVRLETEHEGFLTTPEHPFAVPGSGWLSAGRLVPGDWVVSERFGAVQLLSARSEPAARPVEVFNLSVASSHSYFVGTDRVLVHNTKCGGDRFELRAAAIEAVIRERDEVNRQITALTQATPLSPRIPGLKALRTRLQNRLGSLRISQKRDPRVAALVGAERALRLGEAEREAAREAFEGVQKELAAFESRPPSSAAEGATLAARTALERKRATLKLSYERTNRISSLLQDLLELEEHLLATDADRRALAERRKELRANLRLERKRHLQAKLMRDKRADPEGREATNKYIRALKRRLLRLPAHLADTERPRDPLELLEEELAGRLQEPPSESRDARVHYLTEQIDTMRKIVEVRREHQSLLGKRRRPRRARERLIAKGGDTREIDKRIEQMDVQLHAVSVRRAQLRVRERLLAQLDGTAWAGAPGSVDEERLREFEAELAAGLENEQQLADIERALDAMDPTHGDLQAAVLDEAHDVDDILSEREELLWQPPSPERAAGLESSYSRLEQELREERAAVEVALSALVNEYAHVQTTQAASSRGPSWQERLRAIQEEQGELLARWRAGLQARLDSAQTQLRLMRGIERLRDEETEAELGREIALFEGELRRFG